MGLKVPTVEYRKKVVARYLTGGEVRRMYEKPSDVPATCPYCYSKLKSVPDLNYVLRKKRRDLYYTEDGFCLVSEKFKSFCECGQYSNLTFLKLEHCDYYFFEPNNIFKTFMFWVPFNKWGCWCNACKNYSEITGGVLKDESFALESDDFISRTDNFRGSYEYKRPMIIVGFETERKMKKFGLKGLCFENVYG